MYTSTLSAIPVLPRSEYGKTSRNFGNYGAFTIAALGVAFFIALPAPRADAQVANTLAFYDFNDGTAKDNSGNGNNGTLSSPSAPTATSAGYQGGGFRFSASDNSGAGDTFSSPVNLSPSVHPELTFGGWFLLSAAPTAITGLISNDTGSFKPTLDIDTRGASGSTWSVFTGSGVLSSGVTASAGAWTFVAGVYDEASSLVTIYADPSGNGTGLVSASATLSLPTTSQQGNTTTTIGRNPNFDTPFTGTMDDVFFVGSALTPSQIQNIDSKGQAAFLGSASAPEPGSLLLGLTGTLSLVGLVEVRGCSILRWKLKLVFPRGNGWFVKVDYRCAQTCSREGTQALASTGGWNIPAPEDGTSPNRSPNRSADDATGARPDRGCRRSEGS